MSSDWWVHGGMAFAGVVLGFIAIVTFSIVVEWVRDWVHRRTLTQELENFLSNLKKDEEKRKEEIFRIMREAAEKVLRQHLEEKHGKPPGEET